MKTDLQIQRDVLEELYWEPTINSVAIGVAVCEGIVTLTGCVPTHNEKLASEMIILKIPGVRGIINKMDVKPGTCQNRDDCNLANEALCAIRWQSLVPDEQIQIKVDKGWITLLGEVDWDIQSKSAFDAVKSLACVKGVTNLITVKSNAFNPMMVNRQLGMPLVSKKLECHCSKKNSKGISRP